MSVHVLSTNYQGFVIGSIADRITMPKPKLGPKRKHLQTRNVEPKSKSELQVIAQKYGPKVVLPKRMFVKKSLSEGTSNCSDNQSESDLEGESLMWNDNIEELLQDVAANDEPLPEPRGKTSIKQAVTSLVSWFVYFLLFWQTTCEAKEAISGFLSLDTTEAYAEAKKRLLNRFGNPFLVTEAYRKKISQWPKIPPNDGIALRKYSDFLSHCQTAMKKIKYLKALDDPNENQSMVSKLPRNLIHRWGRIVDKWISDQNEGASASADDMGYPPFSEFCAFLASEARIACNPVISSTIVKTEERKREDGDRHRKDILNFKQERTSGARSFATGSDEVGNESNGTLRKEHKRDRDSCVMCKESHCLDECQEFLNLSIEERVKLVRTKGLCLGCLSWGHMRKSCRMRINCTTCNGFHPSRDSIPARRSQIPRPETARNWPHLHAVANQLMPYRDDVEVGLLIGLNCARAIKPREVIPGADDDPYAKKTALGRGVIGIVDSSVTEDDDSHCSCYQIMSREVLTDSPKRLCHFAFNTQVKEVMCPMQVTQMFELDFNEVNDNQQSLSHDDRRFIQKVKEGIHKRQDGHYEIPLPLKENTINLPNNKQLALSRLVRLKGRLKSNERYRSHYQAFMNETIGKGYAERVPTAELSLDDGQVWYIPHHGVYHPKKPDKIRVVFDASAEFKGESLNRHLLQGPDLTNNLAGVLCRFRKEPIALMCDIEGMFHQVKVNVEQRNLLRFLWWEDGDIDKDLIEYRMTVHLFGAGSSPGCSNFALKTTADDNQEQFGSEAAEFVRNDFYVDDGLKSVAGVKEAIGLIENTKALCTEGGFNLHKFVSNSKEVIEAVPKEQRAKGIKDLDLTKDHLPIERALGVQWCVESDQLQFRVELKDRPLTRRGILSTVSSIYYPLGIVAPVLLVGKRLLQELCKDKAGWDEKVPDSIRPRWERWRSELHSLADLNIPRCYKPDNFGECTSVELHNFSDASLIGYGQCTYLRMVNIQNEVHCSLVMEKSRVTPLKSVTVPRLELAAALVSAKICAFVRKELKYDDIPELFWTDSQVVLGYISNDARRFHTYVANRVQQIRDLTSPKQWKYVDTKENPADDASRGLSAKDLVNNTRWWNGPSFLWNPLYLNDDADIETSISPEDPEVRKVTVLASTTRELPTLLERLKYFSDWHRAKNAVALCLRYLEKLKCKSKEEKGNQPDQSKVVPPVSVEEMQRAERKVLQTVQREAFPSEIERLKESAALTTEIQE
ncbi:hypothetical protein QZH41_000113 [Actinostola sp. cb2023]|nr:hypothetical protein QZH41_000113 [Actinostola sp. cb2023]